MSTLHQIQAAGQSGLLLPETVTNLTTWLGASLPGWAVASLDELVAAALILYPRYWVPRLACLVEVETAIAQLKQPKQIEHWSSILKAHLLLWFDRLSNRLGQGPK